jgi:predicted negative regulator of RcsB-dependent stress response
VDTQTRHALKKDKFAQATASSVSWVSGHRSNVLRWVIAALVLLAVAIAALIFWTKRTDAADNALGSALDVYSAPLATPGAPPEANTYTTASDRSRAANKQFLAVAQQYGWLPEGTKAHYFAGITSQELGQTASAESELKIAAGSWDHNLANLAKVALAAVYHQSARDPQAIDLYNQIIAKPSETVAAGVAQLDLADLYVAENNTKQARDIWAKLKDSDKDGEAGSIATQKLAGKK